MDNENTLKNSNPEKKASAFGELCRTCMDFKSWMKLNRKSSQNNFISLDEDKRSQGKPSTVIQNFHIPSEDEYPRRGSRKETYSSTKTIHTIDEDEDDFPKWGLAAEFGCPADSLALGRGTWRLLHTTAAYYPESPSDSVKTDMKNFIQLFSKFYPCPPCAEDFRGWIKENPPDVANKSTLSKWFCDAHNEVNRKLGKQIFDCSLFEQRWFAGWKDGSCD